MSKQAEIKAAIESVRQGASEARVLCPGGSAAEAVYRRRGDSIVRDAYGPDGQDWGSRIVASVKS